MFVQRLYHLGTMRPIQQWFVEMWQQYGNSEAREPTATGAGSTEAPTIRRIGVDDPPLTTHQMWQMSGDQHGELYNETAGPTLYRCMVCGGNRQGVCLNGITQWEDHMVYKHGFDRNDFNHWFLRDYLVHESALPS